MTKNVCWMAGINLAGLWSNKPIRGYFNADHENYWDRTGNLNVETVGEDSRVSGNLITFASKDKREVEIWLHGANSVMELLRRWSRS